MWVQVLESLSECLSTQWRDCLVPIMGEHGELNSPSHLSKTAVQHETSVVPIRMEQANICLCERKKILIKVHIDAIN